MTRHPLRHPGMVRFYQLGLLCFAVLAGCTASPSGTDENAEVMSGDPALLAEFMGPIDMRLDPDRFHLMDAREFKADAAWDILATDMDMDGDQDVLINWHLGRFELYENVGGRLNLANPRMTDKSGLYDNPGIPDLFAHEQDMAALLSGKGPGVHVWHDEDRFTGRFNLYVVPGSTAMEHSVTLTGNVRISQVEGVPSEYLEQEGSRRITISADYFSEPRHITVNLRVIAHSLSVDLIGLADSQPSVHLGRQGIVADRLPAELTKPDPHGMAWVHAWGSPEPDLFISRGAVRGELAPPSPGKYDRFLVWEPAQRAFGFAPADTFTRNYGRGRQVAWINLDNTGDNELYVSNGDTPNQLWQRHEDHFDELGGFFGVDFQNPISFESYDIDGDGFDDLIFVESDGILIVRNVQGEGFELIAGSEYGLELPAGLPEQDWNHGIDLHPVDVDNDGDLDLWLTGLQVREADGEQVYGQRLYRRNGDSFVDVTTELGLEPEVGFRYLLAGDLDNDGYIDGLAVGGELMVLRNLGGSGFEQLGTTLGLTIKDRTVGTLVDVNGDMKLDAVFAEHRRQTLINYSETENSALLVEARGATTPPIGAIVRAYYADGTVNAQRVGSAHNTRWSQMLRPLHFGVPEKNRVVEVGVTWPGVSEEVRKPVEPGAVRMTLWK